MRLLRASEASISLADWKALQHLGNTSDQTHLRNALKSLAIIDREEQDDMPESFECLNESALIRSLCHPCTISLRCSDVFVVPTPHVEISSVGNGLGST